MSNSTGIAILGAGRWGVHLVRNFLEHPQARVMAVVDPHPERLAAVRSRLKLDDSVVLATAWEQVRDLPGLEAVAIATPASTHYDLIADALKRDYHVLSEKPLTLDPVECLELCHLAEQRQRQLLVDHTYLFHPAVQAGKEVIQTGRLGELRYGYAARTHLGPVRQDVDALWDLAIHDIGIFNTWLGERPITAQAIGNVWLQPGEPSQNKGELFTQGLYDLVMATLTYPSGFQAFIHLCWFNPDKQRRLAVVGSQGTLIFDELSAIAPLTLQHGYLEPNGEQWIATGQSQEVLKVEPGEPLARVCDRFLHCVHHNTTDPNLSLSKAAISSGWVGTEFVATLRALTQSIQEGGQSIPLDK